MSIEINDKLTRQQYEALRAARAAHRNERAESENRRERASMEALARFGPRTRRTPSPFVPPGDEALLVFRRAPRLQLAPYATAVRRVLRLTPFRVDWKPRGRGGDALFRSLAAHHLARYATPALLWSVFFEPFVEELVPLVVHVAKGGSLFDFVRTHAFPVPLTRRMCHDLLAMPFRGSLLHALRRVEVRAVGGDDRLVRAWMRTPAAQRLGSPPDEAFWLAFLQWMARVPELDPRLVGPLVDYVSHRRGEDPSFSMSGRSLSALERGMREWHRELAHAEDLYGTHYQPSGFEPFDLDLSRTGPDGVRQRAVWHVREVLTGKELAAEGRRMGHCVYSYGRRVETREVSIWTVTLEDGRGETGHWAMLTVEVRNASRRVVQARGRFNRRPTTAEMQVLQRWAGENDLEVVL